MLKGGVLDLASHWARVRLLPAEACGHLAGRAVDDDDPRAALEREQIVGADLLNVVEVGIVLSGEFQVGAVGHFHMVLGAPTEHHVSIGRHLAQNFVLDRLRNAVARVGVGVLEAAQIRCAGRVHDEDDVAVG